MKEELQRLQEAYEEVISVSNIEEASAALTAKLTTQTSIEQRIRVLKKKMGETHKRAAGGAGEKALKDDLARQMKNLAEVKKEIAALKRNENKIFEAETGITLSEDTAANIAKLQKNINSLKDKVQTRRQMRQSHIHGRNDPKKVAAFDADIAKKNAQIARMQDMIKKMRERKAGEAKKEKAQPQHQQKAA